MARPTRLYLSDMLKTPPREPGWVSWLLVALWSIVILATIPFARAIQRVVSERWGRESFMVFALTIVGVAAAAAIVAILRKSIRMGLVPSLWLLAVTAMYFIIASRLKSPEEALHFLEYGLLGVLAFRALSHRLRDPSIYLAATLICAVVGIFDEALQWMTPERYWEFRDVWLNVISGGLAQVAIWKGWRPPYIAEIWSASGLRVVCRLGIGVTLLLTLCALNTPHLVVRYTELFPRLDFLRANPSAMAEYGYRHYDPGIGLFFSRLTRDELARQDQERAQEVAAVLDSYREAGRYEAFLTRYLSWEDPLLYEARVRLFRRDRYLGLARESIASGEPDREPATIAWREELILRRYFPRTLATSSYGLPPQVNKQLEELALPEATYTSAVGQHLLTRFTKSQRVVIAGLVVLTLVAVDLSLGRRAFP